MNPDGTLIIEMFRELAVAAGMRNPDGHWNTSEQEEIVNLLQKTIVRVIVAEIEAKREVSAYNSRRG